MLEAKGVDVTLGGRVTLKDFTFAFEPGQLTIILGPNGAGKSTLIRSLGASQRLSSGCISLGGVDLSQMSRQERASRIAVLSQFNPVAFDFVVADLVCLGLPEKPLEILSALQKGLCLDTLWQRRYCELSGGEQQRVHWARVLLQSLFHASLETQYILLDEPTAHMDLRYQHLCLSYLKSILGPRRGAVAVVHDLHLAIQVADQVLVIKDGGLIFAGKTGDEEFLSSLSEAYGMIFRASNLLLEPCVIGPS